MIFNFNTKETPTLSQVGGKAKALIETTRAGFPVPEGFVLSVDFFDPWVKEIKGTGNWKAFLNSPTKESCDALKKSLSGLMFSKAQENLLKKELSKLSEKTVFAVRSSSPEEDLEGTSFAGQYETILGVTNAKLESAIVEAFTSMLDTRVVEYKKQNNLPIDNPCIAIIVQKQIASDVSGVGFSLNPNNNCYDEVMINAAFGLGESIVSGIVSPDIYVVDAVKKEILEKKINKKKIALWLSPDGGTFQKENEEPCSPALTAAQIFELMELIKKCETHYQCPMDTEWAFENGKLYLLQSRPITTYFTLYEEYSTKPGETKHLYADLVKLSQGFEYSLSELGADLFSKMIVNAKQGTMPHGKDGAFYTVNGRIYMDFTNIARALSPGYIKKFIGSYDVPTRKIMKDFDFKKGYRLKKKPAKLKDLTLTAIKMIFKIIPAIKKASKDPKGMLDNYFSEMKKGFRAVDDIIESGLPFAECVDAFMEKFRNIMVHATGVSAAVLSGAKIKKMFKGKGLDAEIVALCIDLPGNPTSEMGYSLVALASSPEVQKTESGKLFVDGIRSRSFSKEFLQAYDEHMMKYGCRCVGEIDTAAVRPYEDLEGFFKQLKLINIHENAMQTSKRKKADAYAKLLEASKAIKKEKQFVKAAEIFKILGVRENPKYLYVYANDKLRQVALKLAKSFVAEGRLETVEDIFMVNSEVITKAQTDGSFELKPVVAKNKAARALTKNVKNWPKLVDSRGKIFRLTRESDEGDLVGDPVSPGTVTGKAKVLLTPFEKSLEKGEILVAKATEPSWTPVFINASAVVMEVGGPLQHGAIIAREYGIPCVTGIYEATTTIKDGDMLEVDGSSGIVKILEKA